MRPVPFVLVLLSLVIPAVSSDFTSGEDEPGGLRPSPFEFLPFEEIPELEDGDLLHSNGMVYWFVSNSSIAFGTIGQDQFRYVPLGFDADMVEYQLEETGDGSVLGYVLSNDQHHLISFDVNGTGVPKNLTCSMFYSGVDMIGLFELEDVPYLYAVTDDQLAVFKGNGSRAYEIRIDIATTSHRTFAVSAAPQEFLVFQQTSDGDLTVDRYSTDMVMVGSIVLDHLEPGYGLDSSLSIASTGSGFYIFAYLDETYERIYSEVRCYYVPADLSSHERIPFSPPVAPCEDLGPFWMMDRIHIMDPFDRDLYSYNVIGLTWTKCSLRDGYIDPDPYYHTLFAKMVNGRMVLLLEGYSMYATSMVSDRNSIPPYGKLVLKDDWTIDGFEGSLRGILEIEGNVTIMNSTIEMDQMISHGNMTVIDSVLTQKDDWPWSDNSEVFGSFVSIRSDISIPLRCGSGSNITIEGTRSDPPVRWDIYVDRGSIEIRGCDFEKYRGTIRGYAYNLRMLDCEVDGSHPFVGSSISDWGIIGSRFTNISYSGDLTVHMKDTIMENSFFHAMTSSSVIENCKFLNTTLSTGRDSRISDSTFISSSIGLILGSGSKVADCRFIGGEIGIQMDEMGSFSVGNCTFRDIDRCLNLTGTWEGKHYNCSIEGSIFQNYSLAIYIGALPLRGNHFVIKDNRFLSDGPAIVVDDHGRYDQRLKGDIWDHGVLADWVNFVNARFNHWTVTEASEVAAMISPFVNFLPFYNSEGKVVSTDDDDQDGMSDDWEKDNALDPGRMEDRYLDPDSDLYSNYEEFMAGTDPRDGGSDPGEKKRNTLLIIEIVLMIIPIIVLTSYVYYLQNAFVKERRKMFEGRFSLKTDKKDEGTIPTNERAEGEVGG